MMENSSSSMAADLIFPTRRYEILWVVLNLSFIGFVIPSLYIFSTAKGLTPDYSQTGNILTASAVMFGFLATFASLQSDAKALAKFYALNFAIPAITLVATTTAMLNIGLDIIPPGSSLFLATLSFNSSLASAILYFARRIEEGKIIQSKEQTTAKPTEESLGSVDPPSQDQLAV